MIALVLALTASHSIAGPPIQAAAEVARRLRASTVFSFVFDSTAEGAAIRELTGCRTQRELVTYLADPANAAFRTELEARLASADDAFARFRASDSRRRASLLPTGEREKAVARALSSEHLALARAETISVSGDATAIARESRYFAKPSGFDPADLLFERALPAGRLALADRAAIASARDYFQSMRACLRTQPPDAAAKSRSFNLLTNIGVSEAVVVGGNLGASGLERIRWKDLSTDMLMALIGAGFGTKIMASESGFWLRWIRLQGFRGATAAVDATIYWLNPVENDSETAATEERLAFNVAYNTFGAARSILVYDLIQGFLCLYPGSQAVKAGMLAARTADAVGFTYVYFALRERVLYQ